MTIGLATGSIVAGKGQTVGLSSLFTVTPGSSNPQFLVVSGLDRNEYTASATGSTGTLSGSGHSTGFTAIGGDGLGAGIVFTYDPASGQYLNSTYGSLTNVVLTTSQDTNRNEAISLFAANNSSSLTQYANNPYALEQFTSYVGTVNVVTQPSFAGPTPSQATPGSIANAAMGFVGQAWNTDGCWVLASNIAAEAGASLPLTSTSVGVPGTANGEWIVAYNGPAGQGGNWQSMVKAGEMISFATSATSGHITTVVSGAGASAMLVDNISYVNANGTYANSAHDGSANDITIAAPHAASQEFSQAVAGSVVIYELDAPVVSAATAVPGSITPNGSLGLSSLITASDPGNRTITEYQVYDTGTGNTFVVNGVEQSAHSAATALTVSASNLGSTLLKAANAGGDTVEVRAFNGSYWGDWQALPINLPSSPIASIVSLANQTSTQSWTRGTKFSFSLAPNTFADSQLLSLTYSASLSNGKGLPAWLKFNSATATFSGRVPAHISGLSLTVTATDKFGLSASETFSVTTPPHRMSKSARVAEAFSLAGATSGFASPEPHGMASTAAHFAQAISSMHAPNGVGAVSNAVPTPNHTPHVLASPLA